jgi:ubiquitin-like protein Pup
MSSQEQRDRDTHDADPPDDTPPPGPGAPAVAADDIDAMLDDIDDVLETNAEEFVKGFVQKGGE